MKTELEYVGFKPHRPGRIHLYCPGCGRKMSNVERGDLDPPTATLFSVPCEECSEGCKVEGGEYRDTLGRYLCSFCGTHSCDRAGGKRRCDERLVRGKP